nr:hypothetical protein HK105_001601 [Polyrhizophydium stewartii]
MVRPSVQLQGPRFAADPRSVAADVLAGLDCDAVKSVFVNWHGLESSDLVRLAKAVPNLRASFEGAAHSAHVSHFVGQGNAEPLDALKAAVEARCGRPLSLAPWKTQGSDSNDILLVELSNLGESTADDRFDALERDDKALERAIGSIAATHPNLVVFVTSSPAPLSSGAAAASVAEQIQKRSQPSASDPSIPYSKRSIIQKYAFFNPALFMGLSVGVLLVSFLLLAVRTLTSLQTPTRFEAPLKKDKS